MALRPDDGDGDGRAAKVDEKVADERRVVKVKQKRKGVFGLGLAFGIVLAVAVSLLVIQNPSGTTFQWLTFDFDAPLWLMLALSFVAGAVLFSLAQAAFMVKSSRRAEHRDGDRAEERVREARVGTVSRERAH